MRVVEIKRVILAGVVVLGLCGLAAGGSALEFDGTNDYVEIAKEENFDFGSDTDFSVCAWIKTSTTVELRRIVDKEASGHSPYTGFGIYMIPPGLVEFRLKDNADVSRATTNNSANDGNWHFVAGVADRDGDMHVYLDGVLEDTNSLALVDDINTNIAVAIGRSMDYNGQYFDGMIDEVGIYNRVLDVNEVGQIYHCGVFDDVNLVGYWAFEGGAGQVAYDGSAYGNDGYLGSDPNGADSADPTWVASEVPGVTYHVDVVNGDNGNDGLTKETAFASIQFGIDSAEDCDTVLVWPGVYNESLFFINKGITVQSAADAAELVASGIYAASLYTSEGPESVLKNFVIRDSDTGVYVSSGAPWLEHLTVVNCDLGVEAEAGAEPNIVNSILWNNAYDLFQCEAQYSWVEEEMEANVVAYWRFEEANGTTAYDWVGDNDGTLTNGPVWTTGKVGGALEFDGVDDYVEISDDPVLSPKKITLAAWIYPDDVSHTFQIIGKWEPLDNEYIFDNKNDNDRLRLGIDPGGSGFVGIYSNDGVLTPNSWQHVAVTWDGSSCVFYVNGANAGENSSYSGDLRDSDNPVTIGRRNDGARYFDGRIDEVGIWDRALSAGEIEQLYENGLAGHEYIDPVFADADGGDYHLKSERGRYWPEHDVWVLDEVSSPCIDAGDARVEPSGEPAANGGRINMGAYGNTAYASMSEWALEADFDYDGAVGLDDVGSFTDEWLEAVTYSQQAAGTALEFDGVDDYVEVSDDNSLDISGAITLGGWVKLDDNEAWQMIISKRGPGGGYPYGGYTLQFQSREWNTGGAYRLLFTKTNGIEGSGGGNYGTYTNFDRVASDKDDWQTGAWYHVAATWDGSTNPDSMKLYIDGQAEATHTASQAFILTNSYILTIGDILPDMTDPLNGRLDDVCIYNRALDGSEIGDIYHSGVFDDVNLVGHWDFEEGEGLVAGDKSGNGNDGTLIGGPVWVESEVPGVTYHVDGAGGDNDNDGLTKDTAFGSIQFGIDTAEGCDRVMVWPGVYNESLFFIDKGITVQSAADAAEITATGLYAASFYNFGGGDATISNFVITDSDTGIYVGSGQPELTNLTVFGNWLGVEAEVSADPNISNCIFWGNSYDLFQCQARYSLVEEEIEQVAYWRLDGDANDSAGSNDGIVYGSPMWTSGQVAGALDCDGVDDYVDVGDPADGSLDFGSGSFTIGLWCKTTAPSGQLVDKSGGAGGRGLGYSLYVGPVEMGAGEDYAEVGALSLRVRDNPWGGNIDRIETINTYNDGDWHHLAAVRTGSGAANLKIYVDGAEVTTFSPRDEGAGDISNEYGLSIGAKFDAGDSDAWEDFFDGAIDEVGIWDRALSVLEIERLYEDGLAGRGLALDPLFADANGGDYHLLSERGRYWLAEDVWVLDDVTSPGVDGGDVSVEPGDEPMPNGARVNMGAYGGTAYASMSEWPIAGDMDEDGIVNMADYAILADEWLKSLPWAE